LHGYQIHSKFDWDAVSLKYTPHQWRMKMDETGGDAYYLLTDGSYFSLLFIGFLAVAIHASGERVGLGYDSR